jgi:hypothetical protein
MVLALELKNILFGPRPTCLSPFPFILYTFSQWPLQCTLLVRFRPPRRRHRRHPFP